MTLADDLKGKVKEIFRSQWTTRDGTVVPESDDIGLGNDAVNLDAVTLYADLAWIPTRRDGTNTNAGKNLGLPENSLF